MTHTGSPAPAGISVVMPILNEERYLASAVQAVLAQQAPGPVEVVLAIGPSTDRTHEVAEQLAAADPRVRLVDNPSGRTPDALNAALAAASHAIVVRVDGHGLLSPGYLQTATQVLAETGAANVGGIMDAVGTTPFERTVACAMKSRLGVGAARFKLGGAAGPAETVYLGVFRRDWLDHVGGYDARFSRAQDWEMNYRIRQAGGLVWFTPRLRVEYRPRGSLRGLARQYRDYGRWRRVVARQHRGSINLRYLAPPAAVLAVGAGLLGGVIWQPVWLVPASYAAAVTLGGAVIARDEGPAVMARMPAVLAAMHLSWGWGFLTSTIRLEGAAPVRGAVQQPPSDGAVA